MNDNELSEKFTQAIRIKVYLIEQNNKSLELLKSKNPEDKLNGLKILSSNCSKEKDIINIFISGSEKGLIIINELLSDEKAQYLGEKSKELLKAMSEVFQLFINDSSKAILKRIKYEELFLNEKKSLKKIFYFKLFQHYWRKELLIDEKISSIINKTSYQETYSFWKNIPIEMNKIPKKTVLKEATYAYTVPGTIPAWILGQAIIGGFIWATPDMDPIQKAAVISAIFCSAGPIIRIGYVFYSLVDVYKISNINYRAHLINELSPSNIFEN